MNRNKLLKKPLLLLFPFEQLAHYLRCLTLAKQLEPHFEIRFAHSERYAFFVEEAGFTTFSCAALDVDEVLRCVKRFDFSWINKADLERVLNSQIAAITAAQPALVLGDAMPTLGMAAEKTAVPYVALMNGYMSKYYADVRTMSWRHPLYKYFRFLPYRLLKKLTKWGEARTFRAIHQPFAGLRRQYGLSKKISYADELEGDLNLICDLPTLFPQQRLPQNYRFIPPLIYQPEKETTNLIKKLDPAKRTLFVSMGSTGNWEAVAFLNQPLFHKYNIVTAGDTAGTVQAPNVIRTSFVNIEPLFHHVDLVLCHGGNGTIYQALLYGIPVLCKTAHFEQEWNVQALEKQGLGASLDAIKNKGAYLQLVERWITKRGNESFQAVQKSIRAATAELEPALMRLSALVPAAPERAYQEQEQTSA